MNSSRFSFLTAVCCLIILGMFIFGCSDDDNPASPKEYGWEPLGTGVDTGVIDLTVYDNMLIAGGPFTTAGGINANRIAAWNDSAWTSLGTGFDYGVFTLTVFDNKLIAGGRLTTAGGASASGIAAWDGLSWAPLGTGLDYPGDVARVHALAIFDTKLIAGGFFTVAGGVSASRIASWNGSSWAPLGTGMGYPGSNPGVYVLTVFDNQLIAGGWFNTAGGVTANNIAAWNGSSWAPLGTGLNGSVYALAVYYNKLIVGGDFSMAGGVSASRIAAWNGSSWQPLGTGMDNYIRVLTVFNNKLIAGGGFTTAGGVSADCIAAWVPK